MKTFQTRPLNKNDYAWVAGFLTKHWRSPKIISRGKAHFADKLPGFIAVQKNKPVGLITYQINRNECEIISLNSLVEKSGIGSALIEAVKKAATRAGCRRLWLITTNDNVQTLRFYQKRGFVLVAVHRNALEDSRKLKPEIPLIGKDGIPLRDEIELELLLVNKADTGI